MRRWLPTLCCTYISYPTPPRFVCLVPFFHLDLETKSHGLSPARETVLELLLRRMSDPGQLVELVSHIPQPSDPMAPSAGTTSTTEANPFVVPSPVSAAGSSASTSKPVSSGDAHVANMAAAMVSSPSPSAIELQCLLLSVATAEGVSKIKALHEGGAGRRGKAGYGGKDSRRGSAEEGAGQGGVGEAAVEMLGRLTNQLLSRSARIPVFVVLLAVVIRVQLLLTC